MTTAASWSIGQPNYSKRATHIIRGTDHSAVQGYTEGQITVRYRATERDTSQ